MGMPVDMGVALDMGVVCDGDVAVGDAKIPNRTFGAWSGALSLSATARGASLSLR